MPAYKDGGRWRYRVAYDGKRYSGSAPLGDNTKRAVEYIEKRLLEKLAARRWTGKMPTVAEFATRFLEFQAARVKPLSLMNQTGVINNHVVPQIGKRPFDAIEAVDIADMVTRWVAAKSMPKTVNVRLGVIRRMLSLAVEWTILERVPPVTFLRIGKSTPRFLSEAEATALVLAAEPSWRAMVVIALRTGLRVGELRGLQWGDVDFARRVIIVRRTDPGRLDMEPTSPKGNRERTVPLSDDAIAALRSLVQPGTRPNSWVWPARLYRGEGTRDRPISEKGAWNAIHRAAELAGLPDVAWHSLRHTCASWLVMRRVPLRAVQEILGHSSIVQTEKYAHLAPNFSAGDINLLDAPLLAEAGSQHATNEGNDDDETTNDND